jgi:hypothetical protein
MSTSTYTYSYFLANFITTTTPSPEDPQCPICKEEYDPTTNHTAVTFSDEGSCKHVYGRHCIEAWLNEPNVNSCAMCRRELFCLPSQEAWGDEDDIEDYLDDEEEEEEEDEPIFSIPDAEISQRIEDMYYKIFNMLQNSPHIVPRRMELTSKFLDTLSLDFGEGRDIESCLSPERLTAIDRLMTRMTDLHIDNRGEDSARPFPWGRERLWREDVKWALGITTIALRTDEISAMLKDI